MSSGRARIPKARDGFAGSGGESVNEVKMSLINQMLQDLDARKAAQGAASGVPNDVRPLPRPQASRLPVFLGFLVLLILAAGAFVTYTSRMSASVTPPDAPPKSVTVEPPAPAPSVPEPIMVVTPSPPSLTEAPPVEQTANESELQALDGSLRMADVLAFPAGKKSESKATRPSPLPARPVVSEAPPAKEHIKVEGLERAPSSASKETEHAADQSARPPMIEKTVALGTPRERAEAEYRKAIAAVNQGRVDEALAGLRNTLQQDGFHQAARQLLVKLLLEAKRPDEAIQVLQDGVQTQPAQIVWAMSLARLQVDRGDLPGAWQTLNFSQPAAIGNADYQGFSGHVLQRLGRHKDAIERYLAAARLSPNDGRWWLGLGLSLEAEGRASEAREAFQRAALSGTLSAELAALVDQKLR
jgi:MSHA biogenesis protein MshN